jgi:hypothetical protein
MAFPHHMKVLKHFLYIQYGSGQQSAVVYSFHHSIPTPLGSALPQSPIYQCRTLTLTYVTAQWCTHMAFQQHLKVLKIFLYIQYGSGKQSVVVYSRNEDITAAFGLFANRHTHNYFATQLDLDMMCISPRVHPYGIPTTYEGTQTLFIHPIWKQKAVGNYSWLPPLRPDTI